MGLNRCNLILGSFDSSSSIMAGYFQNRSCDPFTPKTKPCEVGNYVEYAISVSNANDAMAGLSYAQEKNIRLVVKNTGHEYVFSVNHVAVESIVAVYCVNRGHLANFAYSYLGRSTGKAALSLWTHNLKSIEFLNYTSTLYTGPAIKMGAGVQAFEAYEAANGQGLRIVGGECPTVGLAGGYTQGGGHSALSSVYGLGADQTLEWEVVTANGTHVTASTNENSDLYWALSGGGGGTYGVVLSMTSKAHADGLVGGAALAFDLAKNIEDKTWDAVSDWHRALPAIVDTGVQLVYVINNNTFSILGLCAPGSSANEVSSILEPFTASLKSRGITYSSSITEHSTYIDFINQYYGPLPYGFIAASNIIGGRLIPRSLVQENVTSVTTTVYRTTRSSEYFWVGIAVNVSHATAGNQPGSNAVLPAWRDALIDATITGVWNFTAPLAVNDGYQNVLTSNLMPQLDALAPGSGAYMNEGNFQQPDWQQDFFGINYDTLRAIKKKYDPENLFYAVTTVGSDAWTVEADGRLCRS